MAGPRVYTLHMDRRAEAVEGQQVRQQPGPQDLDVPSEAPPGSTEQGDLSRSGPRKRKLGGGAPGQRDQSELAKSRKGHQY